jgi:GH24 family phage-related lysozyme (muramidase)
LDRALTVGFDEGSAGAVAGALSGSRGSILEATNNNGNNATYHTLPDNETIRQSGKINANALNKPFRFTDSTGWSAIRDMLEELREREAEEQRLMLNEIERNLDAARGYVELINDENIRDELNRQIGNVLKEVGHNNLAVALSTSIEVVQRAHISAQVGGGSQITDSRYSLAFIEFIISYETHTIVDGRHVLSNNGQTIGYGHDLINGESFENGLSEDGAIQLLIQDLDASYGRIDRRISGTLRNHGYDININNFTENEINFLVDFSFNRGQGLVNRSSSSPPHSSLTLLIIAVSEKDYDTIVEVLRSETLNTDGVYYAGLERRRMDQFEILMHGEYTRHYDINRGYRQ